MKMISHFLMMLMLLHSGRVCEECILAVISSLGKIIRLMSPHFKIYIYIYTWLKNPVLLYFLRRNRKRWRNPSFYPIPPPITEVIFFFSLLSGKEIFWGQNWEEMYSGRIIASLQSSYPQRRKPCWSLRCHFSQSASAAQDQKTHIVRSPDEPSSNMQPALRSARGSSHQRRPLLK